MSKKEKIKSDIIENISELSILNLLRVLDFAKALKENKDK